MDIAPAEMSTLSAEAATRHPANAGGSGSFKQSACIRSCETLEDLDVITNPEVELVIWRRTLPQGFQDWLAGLDASLLPHLRVLVRPEDLIKAMDSLLTGCGMPQGAMRSLLICDIHTLVSAFAHMTRSDLVDVRLERVSDDACWKFHRDCVEARLLTTYRGPTTEWVQPAHGEAALHAQTSFDGPIERMDANDVAVFKGSCAGAGNGIVHRSPPIAGTGQTRLLLCLNKPSAVSPEPWSERAELNAS